jgi:hypothetical protein
MPFVSSVRGSYGPQDKRFKDGKPTNEKDTREFYRNTFATGGTITYAGGYVIHTFTSAGTFDSTNLGTANVEAFIWGGAGGGQNGSPWGFGSNGGGGGFAGGTISMSPGIKIIKVGGRGRSYSSAVPESAGTGNTWGNGSGGGLSGVFNNNTYNQGNALLIAGGGGGAGASRTSGAGNVAGAGGGTNGVDGSSPYAGGHNGRGGTQSAGGATPSGNSGSGAGALQGGTGASPYGGGGGGGYFGGSGGGYVEPETMGGGGGGSGFFNSSLVSSPTLTAGSGINPGNSGSPFRGTAGVAGAQTDNSTAGIVVLRYLI